jgi:hypothetical protein
MTEVRTGRLKSRWGTFYRHIISDKPGLGVRPALLMAALFKALNGYCGIA